MGAAEPVVAATNTTSPPPASKPSETFCTVPLPSASPFLINVYGKALGELVLYSKIRESADVAACTITLLLAVYCGAKKSEPVLGVATLTLAAGAVAFPTSTVS